MALALAQSQVNAGVGTLLRQPTFPNVEHTSIISLSRTGSIPVGAPTNYNQEIAIFRSPTYPVWNTIQISTPVVQWSLSKPLTNAVGSDEAGEYTPLDNIGFNSSTSLNVPNGLTYNVLGMDGKDQFVYIPRRMKTVLALITSDVGTGSVRIHYEIWMPSGRFKYYSASCVNETWDTLNARATYLSGSTEGMWIRILGYVCTVPVTGTIAHVAIGFLTNGTVALPTAPAAPVTALFPLGMPTEWSNATLPYTDTRCTALTVKFENVTKVLEKEGYVRAVRAPIARINPFTEFSTNPSFQGAHVNLRYSGKLQSGLFTFTLEDERSSVFQEGLSFNVAIPSFRLDGVEYANLISMVDLDGSTPSTLTYDLRQVLEFRSASQLWPVAVSTFTVEAQYLSQRMLAAVPPFYPSGGRPQLRGPRASSAQGTARPRRPQPPPEKKKLKRFGPITQAQHMRKQRRLAKRKAKRAAPTRA